MAQKETTYIKGKDTYLEASIETMQGKLTALGFSVEEVSWLNPVENCYSVHLRDTTCPLMFTNGKGGSAKAALASALGEYFERLSNNFFFADYFLGEHGQASFVHYPHEKWFPFTPGELPEGLLDKILWAHFDPEQLLEPHHLVDRNSGASTRGICALPYERISDGATVYLPVNFLGNIFVSNGMAAGNSMMEARVQALSEILERAVKNRIIREGICLPEVPQEVLANYPHIMVTIEGLKAHGFHIRIADASLGGLFPVMSVTLINPREGSVFASFGAHPCFEVALERTVTELLQGRTLDQLSLFEPPSFDAEEIASMQNIESHFINSTGLISYDFFKSTPDYPFVAWDFQGDTAQEYAHLVQAIEKQGGSIYVADFNHLGVYACRMIVPGWSDIYPVEDLVWSNNNEGAAFRERILTLSTLGKKELKKLYLELEELGVNDAQRVVEFLGVAPDVDTPWKELTLGEMKALLALACGHKEALDWVRWSGQAVVPTSEKARMYRCLEALIEIKNHKKRDFENYRSSFYLLYGEELVLRCLDIIAGEQMLFDLGAPGLSLDGWKMHTALLEGYAKLQKAKAAFGGWRESFKY